MPGQEWRPAIPAIDYEIIALNEYGATFHTFWTSIASINFSSSGKAIHMKKTINEIEQYRGNLPLSKRWASFALVIMRGIRHV